MYSSKQNIQYPIQCLSNMAKAWCRSVCKNFHLVTFGKMTNVLFPKNHPILNKQLHNNLGLLDRQSSRKLMSQSNPNPQKIFPVCTCSVICDTRSQDALLKFCIHVYARVHARSVILPCRA